MRLFVEAKGLEKAQKLLMGIPQATEKASMRALNRAILAARTMSTKAIGKEYTVKAKDAKADMILKKAHISRLYATLVAKGSPLDLMLFKVRATKGGDVYAQVKRGGGKELPHSFFVTTGNPGIYHRTTAERLPIQREYGPSVPQMIGSPAVIEAIDNHAQEVLESRLEHEIDAILEGYVE